MGKTEDWISQVCPPVMSTKEEVSFRRKGLLERRKKGLNEWLLEKQDVDGLTTSTNLLSAVNLFSKVEDLVI